MSSFVIDMQEEGPHNSTAHMASFFKMLLLVLLTPVLCCGFLCEGGLPLCVLTHHCAHTEEQAAAAALPLDHCGEEHGEQMQRNHVRSQLMMLSTTVRVKNLGPAPLAELLPPLPPLCRLAETARPTEPAAPVSPGGVVGQRAPLRC